MVLICIMADFPRKTLADWEKAAAKELRDKPLSSLDWVTPEGIAVKPLYTEADLEGLETTGSLPGFQERKWPSGSNVSSSTLRSMPGNPLPGVFSWRREERERSMITLA